MQIKSVQKIVLISIIVLFNIAVDQISKTIVRNNLDHTETIHVIKDTIMLKKAENTGAALGIGANLPSDLKIIYFQILPIIFLVFLFRMIIIETDITKVTTIGIAFAIGGGVGNILDRILYGSVTDFIIIKIGVLETGIFNFADLSVIIGIVLVFWEIGLSWKTSPKSDF